MEKRRSARLLTVFCVVSAFLALPAPALAEAKQNAVKHKKAPAKPRKKAAKKNDAGWERFNSNAKQDLQKKEEAKK